MTKPKNIENVARQAKIILKKLEASKKLYEQLDNVTNELIQHKDVLNKFGLMLVDNYATKNTVFKATAIRRYELKAFENKQSKS